MLDFEIRNIFRPENGAFTVFVVEQRFAIGRGHEFFQSYINTPNYFDSEEKIKRQFSKVVGYIGKSVAPVSTLMSFLSVSPQIATISEIVSSLCKLFTVHEHQAAGPEVIDPIIIQEGQISKRELTKIININKDSILCPSIIILLKDNDFDRAKVLLSECPDGIYVKTIRNNGEEEIYKVVNHGAEDIDSFIASFSEQCFSTCSKTKRDILLDSSWAENSIISSYSPQLFRIRSCLLIDQKESVHKDLSNLILTLTAARGSSERDECILRSMECIAKLFRVFCLDYGGQDIVDAADLANQLNNEVLLAQVYRYAEFLPNCSQQQKDELYMKGYSIFQKNKMEDHAIYCRNNMLVQQFYTDTIFPDQFRELQIEAINNVPGMVGMSHIYNNVGVAYLYCGLPEIAIDFFTKGLDYARYQDRIVQNLALESNRVIAESYSYNTVDERRLHYLFRRVFDGMGLNKLPFLAADFALNILAVAYRQNPSFGRDLVHEFPALELINRSFAVNTMGSGHRLLQLQYLATHYSSWFTLLDECKIPTLIDPTSGKRMEFTMRYGLSPFDFDTWL